VDVPVRKLALKNPDFATLAHISDLHFTERTAWQGGTHGAEPWSRLVTAVREIAPDLIAVTGDVVDSPDPKAFSVAREFLEHLCASAQVAPDYGLFVVPGNHDIRFGGFARRRPLAWFMVEFERYMIPCVLRLGAPDRQDLNVAVLCMDSNGDESVLACGDVSQEELARCKDFLTQDPVPSAYSIVLVHHHPTPVISSEIAKERWLEPTMILKNAGTVMDCLIRHGANLVLHGHKHWDGMTQIMSPSVPDHVVCVVAAGSVGKTTGDSLKFNQVRIRRSHVATVLSAEATPGNEYTWSAGTPLGAYDVTRIHRRERLLRKLKKSLEWEASRIEHRLEIALNGDAKLFRAYRGLKLRTGPGDFLPITIKSTASPGGVSQLKLNRDRVGRYKLTHSSRKKGLATEWGFKIFPPATVGDVVGDAEFTTVLRGAFHYVQEEKAAFQPQIAGAEIDAAHHETSTQMEWWDYTHKDVYTEQLVRVLTFPPELRGHRAEFRVNARALDYTDLPADDAYGRTMLLDPDETTASEQGLVQTGPGQYMFVVHKPLPGYRYRLEWELFAREDYNAKVYAKEDPVFSSRVSEVRRLIEGREAKRIGKLTSALGDLCDEFAGGPVAKGRVPFQAAFLLWCERDYSLRCVAATPKLQHLVDTWIERCRSQCVGQAVAQRAVVVHWPDGKRECQHHEARAPLNDAKFVLAVPIAEPRGTEDPERWVPTFGIALVMSTTAPKAELANRLKLLTEVTESRVKAALFSRRLR
jgi:3',5'-cyclic AMP phosphodiesterase CpdA